MRIQHTKSTILLVFCLLITMLFPGTAAASPGFSDVNGNAWYADAVGYLADRNIIAGYGDGTFGPARDVTVAEFLAMTIQALDIPVSTTSGTWSQPFIQAGQANNFFDRHWFSDYNQPISRGDVALILSRALELDVPGRYGLRTEINDYRDIPTPYRDYALNVYGAGLMAGYPDGTLGLDRSITRAEAACLVRKIVPGSPVLAGGPATGTDGTFSYQGVTLGLSRTDALSKLGQPDRISENQWGGQWYVYNRDYRRFAMIGIQSGVVNALFSNAALDTPLDLSIGTPYGGLSASKIPILDSTYADHYNQFKLAERNGDTVLTVFFDNLDGKRISGLFYRMADGHTTAQGSTVQQDMARDLFDLINATRVRKGLPVLTWSDPAATAARNHARDMHDRTYFSHTCLSGSSPQDRLERQGIDWSWSGENLAAGQRDVFQAHNALLNSTSHRTSILSPNFKQLGTGIWIGPNAYRFYYVENYFTSR